MQTSFGPIRTLNLLRMAGYLQMYLFTQNAFPQCGIEGDFKHFVDAFNVSLVTESDIWSPEEIEAYTAAILKVDKDFFTVAREVGAVSCSQL